MRVGYAWTCDGEDTIKLQLDALRTADCTRIVRERTAARGDHRVGLSKALAGLARGDQLVVWRLDRLAASLPKLLAVIELLRSSRVGLCCITEKIDTKGHGGAAERVLDALLEFGKTGSRERTSSARAARRARGRRGGRPPLPPEKVTAVRDLWGSGKFTADEIAAKLEIHRSTVFKYCKSDG